MFIQVGQQARIEKGRPAVANPHDVPGQRNAKRRIILGACSADQSQDVFLRVEPVGDLGRRRELLAKQLPEIT